MSVTAPAGVRAAGVAAGLKSSGRDVALVVVDGPAPAAAGVVTANRVKAAPVKWTQQVLRGGAVRAVLLNSGGANACTGPAGDADTRDSAGHVAARLGLEPTEVAVCSTGLIGVRLDTAALGTGIDAAVTALDATPEAGRQAADAIRTTDTVAKTAVATTGGVTVGGMAKGAGMLAPTLATMLAVLTTDVVAEGAMLQRALAAATAATFDRVDADGCMSTNDTVLLLATGASGIRLTDDELTAVVTAVCDDLCRQLVADAEGATKQVLVEVTGAASGTDAQEVARTVARSALLKCALAGSDPNWGRVVSAVGTTAASFDPDRLGVAFNGVWVCRDGALAADRSGVDISGPDVTVTVDLRAGRCAGFVRTTDLTAAYVHENSAYSS